MLGLTEIRRRRLQFGLVTAVVVLVAYLVLMVTGLGLGLYERSGTALLALDGDYVAYSSGADLSVIRSQLGERTIEAIGAEPGVDAAAPLGYAAAAIQDAEGTVTTAALLGYEPGSITEPSVIDGRALTAEDTRGLLVDRSYLAATGLAVGDRVRVPSRLDLIEFEIVGVVDEGYFFFQPVTYLLLESWAEVSFGAGAAGGSAAGASPAASVVLVQGEGLNNRGGDGFVIVDKQTAFNNIEGVSEQQATVDALRYMGLLIGAMVVGVFFYVITLQKVGQLGVLKAIGASGLYLAGQGALQVLATTALGAGVAVVLALATNAALPAEAVPIAFDAAAIIATAAAVIGAGLVGSAISARQVAAIDPIIAMQQQP